MADSQKVHRTRVRVRYQETDQMGVVHHGVYVTYFELGRTEMLLEHGLDYAQLERRGVLLTVVDVGLRYRAPGRFGDVVVIETRLAEVTRVRVRFEYRVRRADAAGTILCEGHSLLACVNRDLVPQRLPGPEHTLLTGLVGPW